MSEDDVKKNNVEVCSFNVVSRVIIVVNQLSSPFVMTNVEE